MSFNDAADSDADSYQKIQQVSAAQDSLWIRQTFTLAIHACLPFGLPFTQTHLVKLLWNSSLPT